jgi:hypothetical protein
MKEYTCHIDVNELVKKRSTTLKKTRALPIKCDLAWTNQLLRNRHPSGPDLWS